MKTLVRIGLVQALLVIGLIAVVLLGRSSSEPSQDPVLRDQQVRESIAESLGQYQAALEHGDVDAIASFYAEDPRFFWVEDGAVRYRSREEVRAALEQVQSYGPATYEFGEARIEVLTDDFAIVSMPVKTSFGDPGASGFSFSVVQTIVMARLDGEWRFLNGHSSSLKSRTEAN